MLALILGAGRVPHHLADAMTAAGRPFRILHLDGNAPDATVAQGMARTPFRIEHLGTVLKQLTGAGVTEVVFAGAIARPPIDPAAIDADTMPLVPAMMTALQSGDDAALRTVIGFFEAAGLRVIGAEEVVPGLLPPPGILTTAAPDPVAERDIAASPPLQDQYGREHGRNDQSQTAPEHNLAFEPAAVHPPIGGAGVASAIGAVFRRPSHDRWRSLVP